MRVDYVLGTSDGGTQRHVRMLADGLAARGVTVGVYGPAATWTAVGPDPAAAPSAQTRAGAAGDASAGTPAGEARDVSAGTPAGVAGEVSAGRPAGVAGEVSAGRPSGAAGEVSAETPGHPGPPRFAAVEIADRPRPSRDLAAIRRLRALLAGSRPEVVHAHGLRAGALAALAVGGAAGRAGSDRAGSDRAGSDRADSGRASSGRAGAGRQGAGRGRPRPALVVTVHNAPPASGPAAAVYQVLERLVARRADTVLCVSGDLEARMRRLGARRVARALVPAPPASAGVSAETLAGLRAEFGLPSDPAATPLVLTVARLAPQKGLGTLIEAAAGWRDRDPAPLLLIAGSGPLLADLTRSAETGGAQARFLGRRDDVPALLAAADVVVLPSAWEGQPLIVQETLRAGRPLVASRTGGIPDLTGEDCALLVPPGDPRALSAAVRSVLDDPALAKRLSEAAFQRSQSLPSEQDALGAAMAEYCRLAPLAPQ
jgi:glycosyltransferase involved in cell wall biosynthesis